MRRSFVPALIELCVFFFAFFAFFLFRPGVFVQVQVKAIGKPPIDTSAFRTWPRLYPQPMISPSGKFIAYTIVNQPVNRKTCVLVDSSRKLERRFVGSTALFFSADDELVLQHGDSLLFIRPESDSLANSIMVQSLQYPTAGNGVWMAYTEKRGGGELVLFNFLKRKTQTLGRVSNYTFNRSGSVLLLECELNSGNELLYVDLETGKIRKIWTGDKTDKIEGRVFDLSGKRLAFAVAERHEKALTRAIWYYDSKLDLSIKELDENDNRIDSGLKIEPVLEFSSYGDWIFCTLTEEPPILSKCDTKAASVDVWGYQDKYLQPDQMVNGSVPLKYKAAIGVRSNNFHRLEYGDEHLCTAPGSVTGDMVVVYSPDSTSIGDTRKNLSFSYYLYGPSGYFYLVSLRDGSRTILQEKAGHLRQFSFSPGGAWLVFFDADKKNFFSYDLKRKLFRNITSLLPESLTVDVRAEVDNSAVAPVVGWIDGDRELMIYDNYDIWRIDPCCKRPPVNLTGGNAKKWQIKMRIVQNFDDNPRRIYTVRDTLLLTGFNVQNKETGFFRCVVSSTGPPKLLTMGPYVYYYISTNIVDHAFDKGIRPIKAIRSNSWVVQRESAEEAPNYFLTNDFIEYRQLSDIQPQANYNWLTSQLITFSQLDGTVGQGVLYKPENFDSTKKYPVIFNYYEELTSRLFQFPAPELPISNINIPWFVSKGYLVFTPDISYKLGSVSGKTPCYWAFNSVVGAAKYLAKFAYVDASRMGIQGHSYGGWETNYIVSHTNLFAAASEISGVTDVVSDYLTLSPSVDTSVEDFQSQYLIESGQGRMGATLWEKPELYLDGSAVLHADQISTPMLIVHNKSDGVVPWRQGMELYLALRRLRKKVWLLQYDGEDHSILGSKARADYNIRLTQFFDYYLKGDRPPKWMTEGIPARLKGIENRYELDLSGKIP